MRRFSQFVILMTAAGLLSCCSSTNQENDPDGQKERRYVAISLDDAEFYPAAILKWRCGSSINPHPHVVSREEREECERRYSCKDWVPVVPSTEVKLIDGKRGR